MLYDGVAVLEEFTICSMRNFSYVSFLYYIKWTMYKYESSEVLSLTLENEAIDLT
jgi:hypothetical protein